MQPGFVFVPSEGWSNWLAQMLESGRRRLLLLCASFVLLSLLGPSNGASNSTENLSESRNKTSHTLEVTRVNFQRSSLGLPVRLQHFWLSHVGKHKPSLLNAQVAFLPDDTESIISAQATRIVPLVFVWFLDASRNNTSQNVKQMSQWQMHQSPLLLPCHFTGFHLLRDIIFCLRNVSVLLFLIEHQRINIMYSTEFADCGCPPCYRRRCSVVDELRKLLQ